VRRTIHPQAPMPTPDPHDLQRFLDAQNGSYDTALSELRQGRKTSHWIWFVFPQVSGLGTSPIAEKYAIRSREEAADYLAHPVLGARLRECAEALLRHKDSTIDDIMGFPDNLKLRSSMTLFGSLCEEGSVFHAVLDLFFKGESDLKTLAFLQTH
jgi:uncharacterized protein (DUF1810 family)